MNDRANKVGWKKVDCIHRKIVQKSTVDMYPG